MDLTTLAFPPPAENVVLKAFETMVGQPLLSEAAVTKAYDAAMAGGATPPAPFPSQGIVATLGAWSDSWSDSRPLTESPHFTASAFASN